MTQTPGFWPGASVLPSHLLPCVLLCLSSQHNSVRLPSIISEVISEPALCAHVFLKALEPEMQIPPSMQSRRGQCGPFTVQDNTARELRVILPVGLHTTLRISTPEPQDFPGHVLS